MTIEASLDRIAIALEKIAVLAEHPPVEALAAPAKTRGRPARGEVAGVAVPLTGAEAAAHVAATVAAVDPFEAQQPEVSAPKHTLADVREALTAYSKGDGERQKRAVAILKGASGVDNLTALTPDKYDAVVIAVAAAVEAEAPKKVEVEDPFALPGEVPSPAIAPTLTLEDVKNAIVKARKRTGDDLVQKIVFDAGGKAQTETGWAVNLKALPAVKFAEVIAAINALPKTK